MHTLLERILCLKDALKFVFNNEFCACDEMHTPTPIELMQLSDDDFQSLHNVLYVLTPFKNAQKALEGDKYVNSSLLHLAINNIQSSLLTCQASADPETEQNLLQLIGTMLTDFNSFWGDWCSYVSNVVQGNCNHQIGIPTYAFWATAIYPRTKKKLSKLLPEWELLELWHDIEEAIISLMGYLPNNYAPPEVVKAPAQLAMVNQ
jgi:hypothetical protein